MNGAVVHELFITQSIVDAIIGQVGAQRVLTVRLRVGELSGVVPDAIRSCFELIIEGTVLAGSALAIDEPSGAARCHSCGTDFALADLVLLCECGSTDVAVRTGRELTISSVEAA